MKFTVSQNCNDSSNRWKAHGPLTREMYELIGLVKKALADGVFYSRDVDAAIRPQLEITEEEAARGVGYVEGGVVRVDIYYARDWIEEQEKIQRNIAARERLRLTPDLQLGSLKFGYQPATRNCKVVKVEGEHVIIHGTRGRYRYTITTTPYAIEKAKENFVEYQKRKKG
jgi:hypothetical protein